MVFRHVILILLIFCLFVNCGKFKREEEEIDYDKLVYHPIEDIRKKAGPPIRAKGGYNFSIRSPDAKYVSLVGDFNNWIDNRAPMKKNKRKVWSITIPLKKGTYSYKFNIDGVWVLDNSNPKWAKDRMGDRRSIIEITKDVDFYKEPIYFGITNVSAPVINRNGVRFFYRDKFAQKVSVAGTFNNWEKDQFDLEKNKYGIWSIVVQIPKGDYYYKYCADGLWKYDNNNPEKADDGQGDYKSVLKIEYDIEDRAGPPFIINYEIVRFTFYNKDLPSKYNISVMGDFNQWRSNMNIMTDDDFDHEWSTTVRLKTGEYYYKFYLAGKEFFDTSNAIKKESPDGREANYLKISLPFKKRNVKFSYKNLSAKKVHIVGDFNNWNPEADPMLRDQYGLWYIVKKLQPGKYAYQYIVDGEWITDPSNIKTIYDINGDMNSFCVLK